MKKIVVLVLAASFFLGACIDKKAEAEKKKEAEVEQQVENIEKEIDSEIETLEKEAEEIDSAINELDNL